MPLLINCLKCVFKPMAAMTMMIKNFLVWASDFSMSEEINPVVFIIEAAKKPKINILFDTGQTDAVIHNLGLLKVLHQRLTF